MRQPVLPFHPFGDLAIARNGIKGAALALKRMKSAPRGAAARRKTLVLLPRYQEIYSLS
jgi:hypothetical protein